jgi:hypothetical protein
MLNKYRFASGNALVKGIDCSLRDVNTDCESGEEIPAFFFAPGTCRC